MAFRFMRQVNEAGTSNTQRNQPCSLNQLEPNNTSSITETNHPLNIFKEVSEGSESGSDLEEKEFLIGDKPLSKPKHSCLSTILQLINSKRKTIIKGLMFAYNNISSARAIIAFISSSFLSNKGNVPAQLCHLYLLSDILYNSQSTKVKYAWLYKELIHDNLPELFESIQGEMSDDLVKEHIGQLMKVWNGWAVFSDEYLIGLAFPMRKLIDEEVVNRCQGEVKERLEQYEDALLEMYSENKERLKEIALANGISPKLSHEEMISRLVSLKEFLIYKEKEIDNCDDLNKTIVKLQGVLSILRNSYNQLNSLDLDGIAIHNAEFEFFDLPLNEPIPIQEPNSNHSPLNNEEDDIDGEPI